MLSAKAKDFTADLDRCLLLFACSNLVVIKKQLLKEQY